MGGLLLLERRAPSVSARSRARVRLVRWDVGLPPAEARAYEHPRERIVALG